MGGTNVVRYGMQWTDVDPEQALASAATRLTASALRGSQAGAGWLPSEPAGGIALA